jgi:hypothetical protein
MLEITETGDGDGRPWRRRGTSLAAELDRKLAGDEPLSRNREPLLLTTLGAVTAE